MKDSKLKILMSKIIKTIFFALLYLLIIYNIIYMILNVTNPNVQEDLNIFGIKGYIIEENSMKEELQKNDFVFAKKQKNKKYDIGDIIAFKESNFIKIHRITKIEQEKGIVYYTTKGDQNFNVDINRTKQEEVEGKVILKISKIGPIIKMLQSKMATIIIILVLIIIYIVNKDIKKKQARRKIKNARDNKKI